MEDLQREGLRLDDDGVVTAVGKGTATITVTATRSGVSKTAKFKVVVSDLPIIM